MERNTKVEVINKTSGSVSLIDPETRVRKFWAQPGDKLLMTRESLINSWGTRGGKRTILDCLEIKDKALLNYFEIQPEIEYSYTKKDIVKILKSGSDEELIDTLNFAQPGMVDVVVETAVEMKLNDIRKREIIKEMTGNDVSSKIDFAIEDEASAKQAAPTRLAGAKGKASEVAVDNQKPQRQAKAPAEKATATRSKKEQV